MKIVHIEDFFHPNAGYQVNILAKYMADDGNDVTVITSEMKKMPERLTFFFGNVDVEKEDKKFEDKYKVKIIRMPLYTYISGRSIYKCKKIWELIDKIKPDVLYVHGNDTYIAIRVFLRAVYFKCTIVTDNHMVDIASINRYRNIFRSVYKRFITPIIIKAKIPVIRTADTDYIMRKFKIPQKQAPMVSLGTDIMLFYPDRNSRAKFRNEYNISEDAFVIMYAGKLDESKGGMLLGEMTCQHINTDKEIVFIIIGNVVGEYGQRVEKAFRRSRYRILRFPTQPYTELAKFYQISDIAVIPKQCSLSIFDFAASGLPVVVEDNETNIMRIKSLGEGKYFKCGDVKDFARMVSMYINMNEKDFEAAKLRIANNAKEKYGYDKQYKKYMKVIELARKKQHYM